MTVESLHLGAFKSRESATVHTNRIMARGNRRNVQEEEEVDEDDGEEEEEEEDFGDLEDEDEADPLAHLPDYVLARVEQLQVLHATRESLVSDYQKERAVLEKKYESIFKPLYADRAAIVQGHKDNEIAELSSSTTDNKETAEPDVPVDAAAADRLKGVPQFWASAMTHQDSIGELITVEDVDCLEHLLDVTCELRDDGKGYTLYFTFEPNDYFTNTVLTKTYVVPNLLVSESEPMLKQVLGDKIDWKHGKSLTHKIVKKKQRGKGKHAGQVRTINKQEELESFFHWFSPPPMPATNDENMDEEEAERLEEIFESDFDVAQAFRCHLIPNAVRWFADQVSLLMLFTQSRNEFALFSLGQWLFAFSGGRPGRGGKWQ
jgi:nucleosome assembly protein 1-like 1